MSGFRAVDDAWLALQNAAESQRRAEAVVYLGEQRYAPAVPYLISLLQEADPGTRYLCARALGQIGDEAEAAVPALLEALRGDDMFLRAGVTGALIHIGYPAVPGLTAALFDDSNAVKRAACKALGKIGNPRATAALTNALQDANAGVRRLAAEALERIENHGHHESE
ncbi:MAG: HEAT repeat domain-containing protein [Chloroflexi bacterium]|nr:HEAT repeat domain-containing protein [Chloroflexota bacterium]MCY4246810.1 HEAT repeat domain-containing protein [Chloroflexota bacterium]